MIVPSSQPETTTPRWQRLRSVLQFISRWLNWLSVALFGSWLLGQLLGRYYFFELFSHFKVQYVWLTYSFMKLQILCSLIYAERNRSGLVLIPFSLLASILYFDLDDPSWVPGDYDANRPIPSRDVRVFHANVLYIRTDYEPTLALLRGQDPDLYVLQEMTPASIRLVTARLRSEFPYWFAHWSKGPCWTLVGSRTPIHPDRALARRTRIIALTTNIRGRPLSLITVHPRTPLLPSWFNERNEQLAEVARRTRHNTQPTVLIGDFNISVFSPIYNDTFPVFEPTANGMPDPNGRSLAAARHNLTQPTWPSFSWPLQIPIDHAFTNDGFRPKLFQTLDHPGSDHKAVVVDLQFSR